MYSCLISFVLQISEDIKTKLESTLQTQYGQDVRGNTTNRLITDAWDSMQRKVSPQIQTETNYSSAQLSSEQKHFIDMQTQKPREDNHRVTQYKGKLRTNKNSSETSSAHKHRSDKHIIDKLQIDQLGSQSNFKSNKHSSSQS